MVLGVGAGGVIAGLAMCAALAHPAGAASLPVSPTPAPAPPAAVPVRAVAAPVASSTAPLRAVVSTVTSALDSPALASLSAVQAIRALAVPVETGVVDRIVPGVVPDVLPTVVPTVHSLTAPSIAAGGSAQPVVTHPSEPPRTRPVPVQPALRPSDATSGTTTRAPPARNAPLAPIPTPIAPVTPPIAPPAGDGTVGGSPAGPGSGLFASPPPPDLTLPAPIAVGVSAPRGTKPQLLVDPRPSPPG